MSPKPACWWLWILLGFIRFTEANAQYTTVIGLPTQWSQFSQFLPVVQPAYAGKDHDVELSVGNLRHLGLWKNNQTFFVSGHARMYTPRPYDSISPKNFHVAGFYILGEDEGQYLHRTRGYGTYSYHLRINSEYTLSAGLALGFMNYSISANDFNSGGSSSTVDGNIGLVIYSKKYHLGFSSNQIFEGYVTPIQEQTKLWRHWHALAGAHWVIHPLFEFKPMVMTRIVPGLPPNMNLGFSCVMRFLSVGAMYRHRENVAVSIGLEKLTFGQSNIKVYLAYNIPLANYTSTALQAFEIILKYAISYKSKQIPITQLLDSDSEDKIK